MGVVSKCPLFATELASPDFCAVPVLRSTALMHAKNIESVGLSPTVDIFIRNLASYILRN